MIIVWEWRTSQIIPSTHHFILYYLSLSWRIWYDNFHCLLILVFISFWRLLLWCHLIWGTLYCIEHTLYYFIIYGIFRASIPLKNSQSIQLICCAISTNIYVQTDVVRLIQQDRQVCHVEDFWAINGRQLKTTDDNWRLLHYLNNVTTQVTT